MNTPASNSSPTPETGNFNRRDFLVTVAGGLSIGFILPLGGRALGAVPATDTQVNAWIRISTAGTVTLLFGGSEMGQGSMSGLAQILAEELKVNWNQVYLQQSDANNDVSYTTGGSSAVSRRYLPLRTAGATARELLVAAAMGITGDTVRANYVPAGARVTYTNPSTGVPISWSYGDLAGAAASPAAQALLPNPIPLTAPADFKLIGQPLARADIPPKTNGSAKFGIDTFLPGMVFAVIKHCPTFGGVLAATPAVPSGAIAVVPCWASDNRGAVLKNTYNAVAVVADNTWKAKNLARALKVSWKLPASTASVDSTALWTQAATLMTTGQPRLGDTSIATTDVAVADAQVATALQGAAQTLDVTFRLPYAAHATLEPLNCSVNITFSATGTPVSCEVWAPSQAAKSVVATVTAVTGIVAVDPVTKAIDTTKIMVHTTFLGGGLGRKIEQDYISQAVQIAMKVKRPVKLTWMREEDFGHDQYRPMALIRAQAGLGADKKIAAWSYRNVSPSILEPRGFLSPATATDSQAVEGSKHLLYARGAYVSEWVPLPAGIPVGFWRSVGSSINAFAVERMMDLLANAAGVDPFVFRSGAIQDARLKAAQTAADPLATPAMRDAAANEVIRLDRAQAVLSAADLLSAWRKTLPTGHFWGMALAESFGTLVCEVVDISQPAAGSLKVHRVACVVDCGTVINPNSVEAQMQGAIVHGLTAALWGEVTFTNGVANQTNFNRYRMLRLGEMPTIDVQIIPSTYAPSGIGEPGVPPIAPAIANAYSRLTKIQVTSLPLFPGSTMGGL